MAHVTWPTICIFGDSIVTGAGADDCHGWPQIFKLWSGTNNPVKDEVYALGVSGDTVSDVLLRIETECQARAPRVIILAVGINDAATGEDNRPTPVDVFEKDYQRLVTIAKNYSDKIILVGLNQIDARARDSGYLTDPAEYDAAIKQIAASNNLPFVDIYPLFKPEHLYDGIHPNSEGHKIIASLVTKEIEKSAVN